jgi:hypothetical protein
VVPGVTCIGGLLPCIGRSLITAGQARCIGGGPGRPIGAEGCIGILETSEWL